MRCCRRLLPTCRNYLGNLGPGATCRNGCRDCESADFRDETLETASRHTSHPAQHEVGIIVAGRACYRFAAFFLLRPLATGLDISQATTLLKSVRDVDVVTGPPLAVHIVVDKIRVATHRRLVGLPKRWDEHLGNYPATTRNRVECNGVDRSRTKISRFRVAEIL